MLKKIVLAATFVASTLVSVPASAGSYDTCMFERGCYLTGGGDTDPPYWVCGNPQYYLDCLEEAGT